ncbi:TolB family protein [Flagellimonas myxillae]|uniref:TolB family protein n=1 Tax=Flagellimonas myxillae TaxID=2942214 RepID=UPI00201F81FD|nr:hypothetical protein [Muricauda myxillae]MCL6266931.1 hypothetical protein [Muricauda myxillae]
MNLKSVMGILVGVLAFSSCQNGQKKNTISTQNEIQDSTEIQSESIKLKKQSGTPDLGPNFNPVASEIAYYSYTDVDQSKAKIFVSNLDGSNHREVSTLDSIGFHTEPKWSPDGKQIAYTNFLAEGAQMRSISSDGKTLTHLVQVTKDGFHMFSSWDLSGEGYYFFHWPKDAFTPDAYFAIGNKVERLTENGRTNRPQITDGGQLFVNRIDDLENYVATKQLFNKKTKRTQDMPELEGEFITGSHSVKTVEQNNATVFILEDLHGEDIKKLAEVPYKGIMFTTIDKHLKYVAYNTSFEDGAEIHLVDVITGEIIKLTEN